MRPIYLDASALVKRYAQERGSEAIAHIFEVANQVFTCKIAFAEVMATFRKKRDEGAVEESLIETLAGQFEEDWGAISTVDLSPELHAIVRHRVFHHSLRALDLLHLSAALVLRNAARIPVVFVCSDQDLLEAARRESLTVFDPEREDLTFLG